MAGFAFFFDSLIIVSNFDFQLAWEMESCFEQVK